MDSVRSAFVAGARALAPVTLGVVPFALVSGVAAVSIGLSIPAALAMSVLVYAGSAQLVAIQLISANTPALLVIVTALIVNLRFSMYSASLAPFVRRAPQRWKWLGAYLLTDQAYAVAISRFHEEPDAPHNIWFYLGAAASMWVVWQAGALAGVFVGAQIPASWQLDFTIPLTFIALAVPAIKNKRFGAVALVASVVAALTAALPFKLGLLVSVFVAVGAGLMLEARAQQ